MQQRILKPLKRNNQNKKKGDTMTFKSYDQLMLYLDNETSDEDRRRERLRNEAIKDMIKNVVEPVKARVAKETELEDELTNKLEKLRRKTK